ncbi:MAG: tetratricopeptide repeat protein [Candidatus Thorarchaeota archaeon]
MIVNVIKDLFEHGQFQTIHDRLAQPDIQTKIAALSEPDQMELSYYHSNTLITLGDSKHGLHVATAAHTILQATDKKSPLLLASLSSQIRALESLGEIDQALKLLKQGDLLLKALTMEDRAPPSVWIPVFNLIKGSFWADNNQNLALDSLSQALTSFESLDTPSHLAATLVEIGYANYHKGEYDTTVEYCQRALAIYEKLKHNRGIASAFLIMGLVYDRKGERDTMAEYYQRSLTFAEASGLSRWIAVTLTYVGVVYVEKSEYDTALGYLRRSLSLAESLDDQARIADTSDIIGWAYYKKGELEKADEYCRKSLLIANLLENAVLQRRGLVRLIQLALSRQDLVQAQTYLTTLQNLATRSSSEDIHFRSRLMEAMVSKASPQLTDKVQALTVLKQLVTEEHFRKRWDLAMQSLLHLCDLLIFEARATGEEEAWEKAKTFLDQFSNRAQNKKDSEFMTEGLVLQAKFAQIDGELQQAQTHLSEAKALAMGLDQPLIVARVEAAQTQLATDFEKSADLIRRNAPLQERLMEARLEEYLQSAIRQVKHHHR